MKLYPALRLRADAQSRHADVVLLSRVRLSRNLDATPFPASMGRESRAGALRLLRAACERSGLSVMKRSELDADIVERLAALELVPLSYLVDEEAMVALSGQDALWASFCSGDHLVIESARSGLDLSGPYGALDSLDSRLTNALAELGARWAFEPDAGFIMADALRCGSGLGASVSLHLPALVMGGLAEQAFKRAMDAGFIIEGAYAARSSSLGSVFGLSLPDAWRESESQALERLGRAALAMVEYERRARAELLESSPAEALDAVGRALGLLSQARSLSRDEALEALSQLRMGAAMGLVCGLELAELDELWLSAKTRIASKAGEREAHARARLLRSAVRGATIEQRYQDV